MRCCNRPATIAVSCKGPTGPTGPGGSTTPVALDIARSVPGGPIDTVQGFLHTPLDPQIVGTVPPIGGAWTYNEVGTASFKAKNPVPPGCVDIQDFGGVPDWDGSTGTDNLAAFNAAMTYLKSLGLNRPGATIYLNGAYFFSGPLILDMTVTLQGSGMGEFSAAPVSTSNAGTLLAFPAGSDGIVISTVGTPAATSGPYSKIQDLAIFCYGNAHDILNPQYIDSGLTGYGVHSYVPFFIDRCVVEGFGLDGVFVDTIGVGGAEGFRVQDCILSTNGGNGFLADGSDSALGIISNTLATINRGWGFYDKGVTGNLYLNDEGQANKGFEFSDGFNRDFKNEAAVDNRSTYVNCFTEGAKSDINFPAVVFGGFLGTPTVNNEGTAPTISYAGQGFFPWINPGGSFQTQFEVGQSATDANNIAFSYRLSAFADTWQMRFWDTNHWWGIGTNLQDPTFLMFGSSEFIITRKQAPLFPNGIFYGVPTDDNTSSTSIITHTGGPGVPTDGTWEISDIVWNTAATAGSALGWRCIVAGTAGTLVGRTLTANASLGDTTVFVNNLADILKWQYITIAGVAGVYQIVNNTGNPVLPGEVDVNPPLAGNALAGAAVSWFTPTFETINFPP